MMHEEIIAHGKTLFQSADNLRRSGSELNALLTSLWEALEEEEFFGKVDDLGDEEAGGGVEWIVPAYAYHAGILSIPAGAPVQRGPSKKAKQIGTISLIARLCGSSDFDGEQPDWPWLNQASLIAGWHPRRLADDRWSIADFDPNDESCASIVHTGYGLWAWRESDCEDAYFFALPIFALTDESALKRFVLRPLRALFNADAPQSVAKEALRDIPVLLTASK